MSIRIGYKRILFLSSVVMMVSIIYFLHTAHTKWRDMIGVGQSRHSSATQRNAHSGKSQTSNNQYTSDEKISKTDSTESTTKSVECQEGKVYFSNDLYDCDGIMKDEDGTYFKETNETETLNETKGEETIPVPANIKKGSEKGKVNYALDKPRRESKKEAKGIHRNLFVNCGGTFPWFVELFLNTYPNSSSYEIFTFLPEISYKIMYSRFPNLTVIPFEASYQNGSKNVNVKSFGAGSEVTESTFKIDLAEWLKTNTRKSDFVILRIDSKEEVKILKHVNQSKGLEYIDKYYTTQTNDDPSQDLGTLAKLLKQSNLKLEIWNNKYETYSDFETLNQNHIPPPGKNITLCKQTEDEEKFALFLFSPSASVNSLRVIDFLHAFSPQDHLPLTIFLPYKLFKSSSLNMETLLATFQVGMYFVDDDIDTDDKLQYNLLRNKMIFVRRLFERYGKVFQYVFAGNNTSIELIASIQDSHHYSFVKGGKDITHLTQKTLEGKTVSIDDTGKDSGDFLLVNIDTPNTEYLALYMARRFAPWLLNISECDVTN